MEDGDGLDRWKPGRQRNFHCRKPEGYEGRRGSRRAKSLRIQICCCGVLNDGEMHRGSGVAEGASETKISALSRA